MSTSGQEAGPFRCTTASASRAEPMFATASRVDRWLLVEQSGPWGPESVPAGRMDPDVLMVITRLAQDYRARLLLIRRPSTARPQPGVRVFLAESRPGREWLMSRQLEDTAALLRLAPPARDPEWQVETEPLYLVCTHGRHDPCCALFGRPVAGALCAREPERTWESSHVGGDRFGANVVVLPAGLYLGRVIPGRVDDLVDTIRAGRIPLDQLRGRSSLSLPVQAAQHFARAAGGEAVADRLEDLLPLSEQRTGDHRWEVVLQGRSGPLVVRVQAVPGEVPHRLTCHAPEPKRFPGFALLGVDVPATS